MTLRPALLSDASSLAALSIEVWVATYLRDGVSGFFADYVLETYTSTYFKTLLSHKDETIVVSQNTNGIDGFIRLSQNRPAPVQGCGTLEISSLYVQPRHHGRGIGRALLQAGIAHSRTIGASDLWLTTNAQNSPAIRFYLANGFAHVGETPFFIQEEPFLNNIYHLTIPA